MSGVTMVTDALPHSLTGLWGSQARRVETKIVSSWLRGMKFIKVSGKSKDAMTKMSLFVGKLFEPCAASECSCFVRFYHSETATASRCLRQWRKLNPFQKILYCRKTLVAIESAHPFPLTEARTLCEKYIGAIHSASFARLELVTGRKLSERNTEQPFYPPQSLR